MQGGLLCVDRRSVLAADLFRASFPRGCVGLLVDPMIGVGGRLVSMLAHIHFEFAARATPLPIGDTVTRAVKPGAPPQIEIPDQHPAEVRDVTDVIAGARAE